jgi:hypothetical protein
MPIEDEDAMPSPSNDNWYWCGTCGCWFVVGEWECDHVSER